MIKNRDLSRDSFFVLAGGIFNFLLAILKIGMGVFGHASVLIADGIESLLDVGGSFMTWLGICYAQKPADRDHPYGHGKAETLAAVATATILFFAGGIITVSSCYIIFSHQECSMNGCFIGSSLAEVPTPSTLIFLVFVIIIKEILYRFMVGRAAEIKSTALLAEGLHHRSDIAISILAFLGITVALLGGKEFAKADQWAALIACFFIFYNAVNIFRQASGDIMDKNVSKLMIEEILTLVCSIPGVESAEKCRVRKSGISFLADIHIRVDPGMTVYEGHAISHSVQDKLMEKYSQLKDITIHLEPENSDFPYCYPEKEATTNKSRETY